LFEPEATQTQGEHIGILGGTFDPVHYAHLAIAQEACCALKLGRVLFVPAGLPPHKAGEQVTPVEHRVAMLRLAIAANPRFALSLVDVQRAGPSYTVDTLRLLRREWGPAAHFYFLVGGDTLRDLPTWHDPAGLLSQATIVALRRPGYPEVDAARTALAAQLPGSEQRVLTMRGPDMDLSATQLRRRVAAGRPIRYRTPDEVAAYICQHRLYRKIGGIQEHAHAASAI
jgi:nicotinate-nucleotide adenylyltransferase